VDYVIFAERPARIVMDLVTPAVAIQTSPLGNAWIFSRCREGLAGSCRKQTDKIQGNELTGPLRDRLQSGDVL
jgi:hypothetical protein